MKEKINEFLKFRSQFTKREWFEINQVVEARLNKKVLTYFTLGQDLHTLIRFHSRCKATG